MPKIVCLMLACVVVLGGCASPAERAARMQAEMEEMIQVYGPACEKLGYLRNDDKWRDCVLRLSMKVELRNANHPATTTCFGGHGVFDCSSF